MNNDEKLQEDLKNIANGLCDFSYRDRVKSRVQSQSGLDCYSWGRGLGVLTSSVTMPTYKKALMKERLLEKIEKVPQNRAFFVNLFIFRRKFVSSFLILALLFGVFSYDLSDMDRVAKAEVFTKLEAVEGDVTVLRGGVLIEGTVGMEIFEKDHIKTGGASLATVEFIDDSVSRISANSEVVVTQMAFDESNEAKTYVELKLVDGEVWSKVVNLVEDEAQFVVVSGDIKAKATKAAFNVANDNGKVELAVYTNLVDIEEPSTQEDKKILRGTKVVSLNNDKKVYVSSISLEDNTSKWVAKNLADDKEYIDKVEQRLLARKVEVLGLDTSGKRQEEIRHYLKSNGEELLLYSFEEVEAFKQKLNDAEKRFIASELKLSSDGWTDAEYAEIKASFDEFSIEIDNFYALIVKVEAVDSSYADQLRTFVKDKITVRKKYLANITPDSPVYIAKQVVQDAEVKGVKNESELIKVKKNLALDKFSEMESAALKGETELAAKAQNDYLAEVNDVKKLVEKNENTTIVVKKDDLVDRSSKVTELPTESVPKAVENDVTPLKVPVNELVLPIEKLVVETPVNEVVPVLPIPSVEVLPVVPNVVVPEVSKSINDVLPVVPTTVLPELTRSVNNMLPELENTAKSENVVSEVVEKTVLPEATPSVKVEEKTLVPLTKVPDLSVVPGVTMVYLLSEDLALVESKIELLKIVDYKIFRNKSGVYLKISSSNYKLLEKSFGRSLKLVKTISLSDFNRLLANSGSAVVK